MTARVGVTKDARLLSGADIGRWLTWRGHDAGPIIQIWHYDADGERRTRITTPDGPVSCGPHEPVTITGADG